MVTLLALLSLSLQPELITGGQAAVLRVAAPPAATLEAKVGEEKLAFFPCPSDTAERCALVGVPAEAKTGQLEVSVTATEGDKRETKSAFLSVREGRFSTNRLKVDPELTHPSAEDQKRMEKEKQELATLFDAPEPHPLWDGPFRFPGKGSVTSRFGNRRTYNGEVKSVHYGVDLRAVRGAPVRAANAGRVVAAHEFFLAGNMVLIDHGAGIFSAYAHLSAFKVKPGDLVKKGEVIGLAGATGRVTGPHLHWAMRVNGVAVDPIQLKRVFGSLWLTKKTKIKKS